ncbi:hypothetical protein BO71DRAFT_154772 [Aspergillus ellipticus CBS 707.79]|uniref:Uncharacterized protein n=1 Tax=Aspergillus ellipticus CBS 707.79 TaxID=1448320 RepID=A0A319DI33_9EURO|nr:hypothetical protein BO71DRAFT_154772 [Aspergillus ellipticus CBS 707.79]
MPSSPTTTKPNPSTSTPSTSSTPSTTSTALSHLESDLLSHLTNTPALDDLHTVLLSSLQRLGWTEKIRRLAQELLRGGRCERFEEVFEAVVASAEGRGHPFLPPSANNHPNSNNNNNNNGNNSGNGNGNGNGEAGNDSALSAAADEDMRIPQAVVEQGVRAIKEVLREVVVLEVEDEGDILAEEHGNGHGHGKDEGNGTGTGNGAAGGTEKGKGSTASPGVKGKKVKAKGK